MAHDRGTGGHSCRGASSVLRGSEGELNWLIAIQLSTRSSASSHPIAALIRSKLLELPGGSNGLLQSAMLKSFGSLEGLKVARDFLKSLNSSVFFGNCQVSLEFSLQRLERFPVGTALAQSTAGRVCWLRRPFSLSPSQPSDVGLLLRPAGCHDG